MPLIVQGYLLPVNNLVNTGKITPIFFQSSPHISSDSKSASYEPVQILGRAEPIRVYKNSGARMISLGLTYVALDKEKYNFEWVSNQVAKLRALVYPKYSRNTAALQNGRYAPPPIVLLNYGWRFINIPCIVTQVSISAGDGQEQDIVDENMLPLLYKVKLELEVSYAYNHVPGYEDIAGSDKIYGEYEVIGNEVMVGGETAISDEIGQIFDAETDRFRGTVGEVLGGIIINNTGSFEQEAKTIAPASGAPDVMINGIIQ